MSSSRHEPIRAVQRALGLLKIMNEREIWTLDALHVRTELPKSTLHRLLATLHAEHYVYSGQEMYGQYRLTHTTKQLSAGVTEKNRLADIARPILIAATKRSKWPLAVGVIDRAVVRANVCTMAYSPYSMRPTCIGQSYDLFNTALGNAYLAYCEKNERRILINLVSQEKGLSDALHPTNLRSIVRSTRSRGYGLRAGDRADETSAIAVPIFDGDQNLVGVLACSTFSRNLAPQWLERVLPMTREAAQEIGQCLGSS